MKDAQVSFFNRLFFAVASLLLILSVLEWVLRWFGYTLSFLEYTPGRLLEFAAIMMVFVIVALLRQIRDLLRNRS